MRHEDETTEAEGIIVGVLSGATIWVVLYIALL
jgi:hypothetical protein